MKNTLPPFARLVCVSLWALGAAVTACPAAPLSPLLAEKNLPQAWLDSLTERGEARVYPASELPLIQMPVGGIVAGQLYFNGDGSLGRWDVMNVRSFGDNPLLRRLPERERFLQQGFAVRLRDSVGAWNSYPLNLKTFPQTTFQSDYPVGLVRYQGAGGPPLAITLEGIAPFVPLDASASGVPAAFLRLTVTNTGTAEANGDVLGWLQNGVAFHSGTREEGLLTAAVRRPPGALAVEFAAQPLATAVTRPARAPVLLADFETTDYQGWTATGSSFGVSPTAFSRLGFEVEEPVGAASASSFNGGPSATGTLQSPSFVIDRDILRLRVAGARDEKNLRIELWIDGRLVRKTTGPGNTRFRAVQWDVREQKGQTARLTVTDASTEGGLLLDQIELSDGGFGPLPSRPDFGTMALALLDAAPDATALPSVEGQLAAGQPPAAAPAERPLGETQTGALQAPFALRPGQSRTFTFAVAWHFPNLELVEWSKLQGRGRWYAARFGSVSAVVDELAARGLDTVRRTDLWRSTWYDSTLPRWLLDRTLANLSTLATNTSFRFHGGRFYGFEGVHSFPGTCNHVWHYEEGAGRLFPELELSLRTQADFLPGVGIKSDGSIPMRIDGQPGSLDPLPKQPILFGAGYQHWASIDGQCGILLRAYRSHLLSTNADFVKKYWPQIRLSTQWLFEQDSDGDNLPDRVTHHTLDEDIAGPGPWISSLWLAAVTASGKMAHLAGDTAFAAECEQRVAAGQKNFVSKLWNGDRFVHLSPEAEKWRPGSYDGSHIDQVLGQQWAWRTGLGRLLPANETRAALASVFRHNFFVDLGPYYALPGNKPSRPFSVAGNAGTVVAAWPEGSYRPDGQLPGHVWNSSNHFHQGFYNETMSGFEHQFASHLIYEGMVAEGLAVERAVHDRHQPDSPQKGNPFNEPEAGHHYARATASYAVFLAASGFDYDGPAGHLGFAPRLAPEHFKAAFTAAEGWGSYEQKINVQGLNAELTLKSGQLTLRSLSLAVGAAPKSATIKVDGKTIPVRFRYDAGTCQLTLRRELLLRTGQTLRVTLKAP